MSETILLCSDLDRTILPNGEPPEDAAARPLLRGLVEGEDVVLAYVSGRSEELIHEAIRRFEIPSPDYAIADVGTSLYRVESGRFARLDAWDRAIGRDWRGRTAGEWAGLFEGLDGMEIQEPERQGHFKLSYYVGLDVDRAFLFERMRSKLDAADVAASLIWSVDEANQVGLLDVLPEHATKLHAVRFLRDRLGCAEDRVVFAGDSGNDLPALISEIPAVLVANARDDVRDEAVASSTRNGTLDKLYLARGGFLGLNGNYSAGVLEGVAHFVDDARVRLESLARSP